ncbi:MAG: transglutaminase family protein [Candidatus Diapherotrites archaeon]|nr:transglutaminase family protein [Candidatus Diapherotrites archaeon]
MNKKIIWILLFFGFLILALNGFADGGFEQKCLPGGNASLTSVLCSLCITECEGKCLDQKWLPDIDSCIDNPDIFNFDFETEACTCGLGSGSGTNPTRTGTAGENQSTGCSWFDQMIAEFVDEEIVINASDRGLANLGIQAEAGPSEKTARTNWNGVLGLETKKARSGDIVAGNTAEWAGNKFVRTMANWLVDTGVRGTVARAMVSGSGGDNIWNPNSNSGPRTEAFFGEIENIQGNNEVDTIKQVYESMTEKVPGYGVTGDKPLTHYATYEEMFVTGSGICRDKSGLLVNALERKGIDAQVIGDATHMWVRVTLDEGDNAGKEFDLDPTWYQNFVPLPTRSAENRAEGNC